MIDRRDPRSSPEVASLARERAADAGRREALTIDRRRCGHSTLAVDHGVEERLEVVRQTGGGGEATLVRQANMFVRSLKRDGSGLLAQQRGLSTYCKLVATMGLLSLYPRANRLSDFKYQAANRGCLVPPPLTADQPRRETSPPRG